MEKIKIGSDFSGVGAFDQALQRLNIDYETLFACDIDKYARQTYIHNYGEPKYFPEDVYEREIPTTPLDIYMTSPPCQAFSLAGNRKGEDDKRGVLFYNSHEFIVKNKPRYFIFENVKGLLSDANGRTFQIWLDMLGGKTVNGNPVIFPREDATPYHVYFKVLNAKNFGIPQNRERVFIVGIRDDKDNNFSFPKPIPLVKKLKDVLEPNIDAKYFLSHKMVERIEYNGQNKGVIADLKKGGQKGEVFATNSDYMSCLTATDYKQPKQIAVKTATKIGYEIATEGDSINLRNPDSETRRGRVGKEVAQTLDTACNLGVVIGSMRGRNPDNPSDRTTGAPLQQRLEINSQGISNTITSVQKDNYVVNIGTWRTHKDGQGFREMKDDLCPTIPARAREDGSGQPVIKEGLTDNQINKLENLKVDENISSCLSGAIGRGGSSDEFIGMVKKNAIITNRIRRLTPRECFRLMDFPDSFDWPVSDTQAYRQAGNSIVVGVLAKIIEKLEL